MAVNGGECSFSHAERQATVLGRRGVMVWVVSFLTEESAMPSTRRHLQLNNACSGVMVRAHSLGRRLDQELKAVRRLKWNSARRRELRRVTFNFVRPGDDLVGQVISTKSLSLLFELLNSKRRAKG